LYLSFGRLVRKHREHAKLTQEALGSRIGLSRTSITNIEKGRQHVALHQLFEIAGALEVPPMALLPVQKAEGTISARLSAQVPADVAAWVNRIAPGSPNDDQTQK
jgi:transcriptional regulator with XRE-family HTH domain